MEKAQNYPVYLNLIRWTILAFLACITVTQVYFRLMGTGGIRTGSVILYVLITVILFKRGWFSWWAAILFFPYAFYYLMFRSVYLAEPSVLEFTSGLHFRSGTLGHVISLIPLCCYFFLPIIFLTPPVRNYYLKSPKPY